ncbi:MAG: hypothetical protein QOG94_1022 [Solirubrobacteraceae bacterium]|jgi:hypothetical protein|nr:hypothetical protein [Pseudonocardiales bacterium]MDX6680983.1 hypothetical protein [Solirubrobacteraceae bacterium]
MTVDALDGDDRPSEVPEAGAGWPVEEIIAAARRAAEQLRADVERASNDRAAQIETAAARQAHAVRMAAEADAQRIVAEAHAAAQQYVTASRRLLDEFARERMRRITEIGDKLAAQSHALVERLAHAADVARQLAELRAALGAAGERIAAEAGLSQPELPELTLPGSSVAATVGAGAAAQEAAPQRVEERLSRATRRADGAPRASAGEQPAHRAAEGPVVEL